MTIRWMDEWLATTNPHCLRPTSSYTRVGYSFIVYLSSHCLSIQIVRVSIAKTIDLPPGQRWWSVCWPFALPKLLCFYHSFCVEFLLLLFRSLYFLGLCLIVAYNSLTHFWKKNIFLILFYSLFSNRIMKFSVVANCYFRRWVDWTFLRRYISCYTLFRGSVHEAITTWNTIHLLILFFILLLFRKI